MKSNTIRKVIYTNLFAEYYPLSEENLDEFLKKHKDEIIYILKQTIIRQKMNKISIWNVFKKKKGFSFKNNINNWRDLGTQKYINSLFIGENDLLNRLENEEYIEVEEINELLKANKYKDITVIAFQTIILILMILAIVLLCKLMA